MNRGWKAAYWTLTILSIAWAVISALIEFYWIINWDRKIVSLATVNLAWVLWTIFHSFKLRHSGPVYRVIARAILPLIGAFMVGSFETYQTLNRHFLIERARRHQTSGSITFDCTAAAVADSASEGKSMTIAWRLTTAKNGQNPREWFVEWPGQKPIPATPFVIHSGNIGGSLGLTWVTADRKTVSSELYLNDIVGEFGPTSIDVGIADASVSDPKLS